MVTKYQEILNSLPIPLIIKSINALHEDYAKGITVYDFILSIKLKKNESINIVERELNVIGIDYHNDFNETGFYRYNGKFENCKREHCYFYFQYLDGKHDNIIDDSTFEYIANEEEAKIFEVNTNDIFRLYIDHETGFISGEWKDGNE